MDELERRIRAANPYRDAPLSPKEEALLEDILAGRVAPRRTPPAPPRHRRPRRLPTLLAAGTLAVTLIAAGVLSDALHPIAAYAATPDPLPVQRADEDVAELRARLDAAPPPASTTPSTLGVTSSGWYLDQNGDAPELSVIVPTTSTSIWSPDGSGSTTWIMGTPMQPDGAKLDSVPPGGADAPGTVIATETWESGREPLSPEAPPETASGMRTTLDSIIATMGASPTDRQAIDYLQALEAMMQDWTLSDAAERAAIEVILTAPGISVTGTTTDRAGRSGLLLDLDPNRTRPTLRMQLVIDPTTWRLLDFETRDLQGDPGFRIPPDAVISYTIWK